MLRAVCGHCKRVLYNSVFMLLSCLNTRCLRDAALELWLIGSWCDVYTKQHSSSKHSRRWWVLWPDAQLCMDDAQQLGRDGPCCCKAQKLQGPSLGWWVVGFRVLGVAKVP